MKTKRQRDFRKLEREKCGNRIAKVVLERIKFDVGQSPSVVGLEPRLRSRDDLQALSPKSKPMDSFYPTSPRTTPQQQKKSSFRNTAKLERKNNCCNSAASDVDVTKSDDEGETQPPSIRHSLRVRKPKIYIDYSFDNSDSHEEDVHPISESSSDSDLDFDFKESKSKIKPKYQRNLCSQRTITGFGLSQLKRRIQGVVPECRYKCELCPEITSTLSSLNNLKRHKKLKHGITQEKKSQTYNCDLCTATFATSKNMERHIVTVHVADKPFECDICFKSLIDEPALKKHINRHLERAELAAKKANLISGTTSENKKYKCIYCLEEFFKTKIEFKQHMQLNHTDNQGPHGPCPLCNLIFSSETDLHDHLQLPKNQSELKCSVCSELLDTQCLLYQHLKEKHKSDLKIQTQVQSKKTSTVTQTTTKANKPGSILLNPKEFQCLVCSCVFPRRSDLHFHEVREKHQRKKCPICSQVVANSESLKNHIRARHSDARSMKCDQCDKTYKTMNELRVHIRLHGSSKYACKICVNRNYGTAKDLRVHMANRHGGERKFKCHLCVKAWASITELNQHLLTHTEERPYPCQYCNRGFKSARQAKSHMRLSCQTKKKMNLATETCTEKNIQDSEEKTYLCQFCGRRLHKSARAAKLHMKAFCQTKKKMNAPTETKIENNNQDKNECDDSGDGNAYFSSKIKFEGNSDVAEESQNEGFDVPRFELIRKKELKDEVDE